MILTPLFIVIAIVCGVTAILDMMMNGSRNADWAPWGLTLAALCGLAAIVTR